MRYFERRQSKPLCWVTTVHHLSMKKKLRCNVRDRIVSKDNGIDLQEIIWKFLTPFLMWCVLWNYALWEVDKNGSIWHIECPVFPRLISITTYQASNKHKWSWTMEIMSVDYSLYIHLRRIAIWYSDLFWWLLICEHY